MDQENMNPVLEAEEAPSEPEVPFEAEKGFKAFLSKLLNGEKESPEEGKKSAGEENLQNSNQEKSFEERLKEEKQKWEDELKQKTAFENLSDEEKLKIKEKESLDKIKTLQDEIMRRDLKDEAISYLNKEGYPTGLVEILKFESKEEMTASLELVTSVFKETLSLAINERLKSRTPEGLGLSASRENQLNDEIAAAVKGGF